MSAKNQIKSLLIKGINAVGVNSKYYGTPKRMMDTKEWVENFGDKYDATFNTLIQPAVIKEHPPLTIEKEVHAMFRNEYEHEQREAFLAVIPSARVWGRNGTVIAPNDILLEDVSREFGAYGGITGKAHSVNKQLTLNKCIKLDGNVAVVGSAGAYNYHHWLYDTLSRIYLLKLAGVFDEIDYFIIDYTKLHFQKESLRILGIPEEKIVCANNNWKFHVEAEQLFIPSLPARLGTINKWTVDFLRDTFLKNKLDKPVRLYISRKKAPTRKLVNEKELINYLRSKGFIEFFAEDHSIEETASYFAAADFVVGIHGSGFANFAFLNRGAKAIDIVAPKHIDPYYWILCNQNDAHYGYLFGNGDRPEETADLVMSKVDKDIEVGMGDFNTLFTMLENA